MLEAGAQCEAMLSAKTCSARLSSAPVGAGCWGWVSSAEELLSTTKAVARSPTLRAIAAFNHLTKFPRLQCSTIMCSKTLVEIEGA
eukprot:6198529-Pleurochrysis_carterae.AAC.2